MQTPEYSNFLCECPTVLAESPGAFYKNVLTLIRKLFTGPGPRTTQTFCVTPTMTDAMAMSKLLSGNGVSLLATVATFLRERVLMKNWKIN
jgi:hypothetical protein